MAGKRIRKNAAIEVRVKEQVHDIETIFHKHIEANFKHIKASHRTEEKKVMTTFLHGGLN